MNKLSKTEAAKRPKCPNCGRHMSKGKDTRGKPRWTCKRRGDYCYSTVNPKPDVVRNQNGTEKTDKPKVFKRTLDSKVFVITTAQNATPVHYEFFRALEQYCDHRNAELLVVPIRYKNATSVWTPSQQNADIWLTSARAATEGGRPGASAWEGSGYQHFLWNVRRSLNKNLILLGDVKTQPTATSPLAGFEGFTHGESAIMAHTRVQLRTVAVPQSRFPKILATTGACTVKNYTDSVAGKKGEFHHTLGALVIEVSGSVFHMRHINAQKDGAFYEAHGGDVWFYGADWSGGKPVRAEEDAMRPLALAMGDTHTRAIDPDVERATFKEIIPQLKPKTLIYHDLADGQSVNHWTERDPFVQTSRSFGGFDIVEEEIDEALQFVCDRLSGVENVVLAPSNHHDWYHQWLKYSDWRQLSPKNRVFYLESALAMTKQAKKINPDDAERLDLFTYWAKKGLADYPNIKVLEYDESYKVADIEAGMHGHLGPNGAKGTARNYAKLGVKTIAGDCHSPAIEGGAWRAGTSTLLRRGYNRGPSGWLNTHVMVYANGKRTMINIINGEWRL